MSKQKSNHSFIFSLLAIVFGAVSIGMLFVNSINVVGYSDKKYSYTGMQATFGYTAENARTSELAFSFMNLLPYILVVLAVVLIVLSILGILRGKIGKFIISGLFLAAGVLFFLEGTFTVYGDLFNNALTGIIGSISSAKITTEITVGAIVAGVSSILGAVCAFMTSPAGSKRK